MNAETTDLLAEALIRAPAGAALLAALEGRHRTDWDDRRSRGREVDADSLAAAIATVDELSIGALLGVAVRAAQDLGGPWWSDAPEQMARAIILGPDRAALAAAVARRLHDASSAQLDPDAQQIWRMNERTEQERDRVPLGTPRQPFLAWMTATPDGLWSVTDPAPEVAPHMLDVWEYDSYPVTCWSIAVDLGARVFEVNDPADWAKLCTTHPLARRRRPNTSWELPGANQHDVAALAAIPNQQAVRTKMKRFVEPDWDSVAEQWDGVHLSWKGFLTCEGRAIDLDVGEVAMLRNWASERTLWLNPVLRDPQPMTPSQDLAYDTERGEVRAIDPHSDPERQARDRAWIDRALGLTAT